MGDNAGRATMSSNQLEAYYPTYVNEFRWTPDKPLTELSTSIAVCAAYLVTIFALRAAVTDRKPMSLRGPIAVHNLFLSGISFVMCAGILIDIVPALLNDGFHATFCDLNRKFQKGPVVFWQYVFFASKFYELLDTVFIVLKHRPLEFLHVFHHVVTLLVCWIGMEAHFTVQWVATVLNTTVHTFMYYYYFRTAMGAKVWWKRYLTVGQMIQFWVNMIGICYWYYLKKTGAVGDCAGDERAFWFGFLMSLSFYLLFQQFYSKTYKKK